MQSTQTASKLLTILKTFEQFDGISDEALDWLIERSECRRYEVGDFLFRSEEPADHMQIIMAGKYKVWREQAGEQLDLGVWGAGYIGGVLPFSRMKVARANAQAIEPVEVLELHRDCFTEMVNVSYELTQSLVGVMSSRIREFMQIRSQNEKLMALGKLSAGLAHELNNPASAIVRSAKELYQNVHYTPEKFKRVITMRITEEQTDQINAIMYKVLEQETPDLSILDRQDALDDLIDWLEDNGIEESDDFAETFVDFGVEIDHLESILDIIGREEYLTHILGWIESTLTLEKLVVEIQESSDRIAELVGSVKEYSHMDRGQAMELTDIRDGIKNTLIILKHRLKFKQIEVHKDFDPELPKFKAFVGQLNQVWTNLIANAIDAMEVGGQLRLRTCAEDGYICVEVTDSGTGISAEVIDKIFDPFFTTKSVSEGTGMGLDITRQIVDRHGGTISVTSEPGNTTFKVCFPLNQ